VGHNAATGSVSALANVAAALSATAEVALVGRTRVVSVDGLVDGLMERDDAWGFLMIASLQMKERLIRAAAYGNRF
jgi:uncharacterized alpha-E superfamily protein